MHKLEQKVREHLYKQYNNVLTPAAIEQHISNYFYDSQSQYLLEKISPFIKKDSKILDIGSGYGSFVLKLVENGFNANGIEIEEFEHNISKDKCAQSNQSDDIFHLGSALSLPFADNTFDVVSFWNVLEHITDYKLAIKEAKRVLKKNGMMFIIAPNYCAFRKEPHYHLPWFPLMPKIMATAYLKLCKRSPIFLKNNIFYITSYGLKRTLHNNNLKIFLDSHKKIYQNHEFNNKKIALIINILKKFRLLNIFLKIHFSFKTNFLCNSMDVIAINE